VGTEQATDHKTLIEALVAFQAECPAIPMNASAKIEGRSRSGNDYEYGYAYADLGGIFTIARPIWTKHGLVVTQSVMTDGDHVGAKTIVDHVSGESRESDIFWLPAGDSAQKNGAAATYARRYSLSAFLGLVTEADPDAKGVEGSRSAPSVKKAGPGPSTEAQHGAIHAISERLGYDRAALMKIASEVAERPIESSKDLTKQEASRMIDRLKDHEAALKATE